MAMDNKHPHLSGILTGITSTVLFNPLDRALYLHIKHHTSFLNPSNWQKPYQGMSNALFNRIVQYGYYYTLVDKFKEMTHLYLPNVSDNQRKIITGSLVGCSTAMLLNPISCIKYHTWGNDSYQLRKTALHMYRQNGWTAFLRGMKTTAYRDTSFSLGYLYLTNGWNPFTDPLATFVWNCGSLGMVTLLTSPLNYARNMKFAVPPSKPSPSYQEIYQNFMTDWEKYRGNTPKSTSLFRYMAHRFCWGWGTARVAVGMSVGKLIYDQYSHILDTHY